MKYELGDFVTIQAWGITGQVVGIWQQLYGKTLYLIRYKDNAGRLADHWCHVEELEAQ